MEIISNTFHQFACSSVHMTIVWSDAVTVLLLPVNNLQLFAVNSAGQRGVSAVKSFVFKWLVHVEAGVLWPVAVTTVVVDRGVWVVTASGQMTGETCVPFLKWLVECLPRTEIWTTTLNLKNIFNIINKTLLPQRPAGALLVGGWRGESESTNPPILNCSFI